jgi:hypothetical protein
MAFAIAYFIFIISTFMLVSEQVKEDRATPKVQQNSVVIDQPAPSVDTSTPSPVATQSLALADPIPATTADAPIAPASYTGKYSSEMTTAGISDGDKPIVASLMLSGDQWAPNASPQMREISRQADPTLRIIAANTYVQERWVS